MGHDPSITKACLESQVAGATATTLIPGSAGQDAAANDSAESWLTMYVWRPRRAAPERGNQVLDEQKIWGTLARRARRQWMNENPY